MIQPPDGDFTGLTGAVLLSSLIALVVVVAAWVPQLRKLTSAISRQICTAVARTRYPVRHS